MKNDTQNKSSGLVCPPESNYYRIAAPIVGAVVDCVRPRPILQTVLVSGTIGLHSAMFCNCQDKPLFDEADIGAI
jgi:hypothetical protein